MRFLRLFVAVSIAILPSWIKNSLYRWLYGYQIGKGVRIGFSPFLGVRRCRIGDHTRIGSLNLFTQIESLSIGSHVQIGFLNVFRGGARVALGDYGTILRLNMFNAIVEGDFVKPVDSTLQLGAGVFVATGHWLDFSDGIHIGDHCIIGGRFSSFWTHNRQRGKPIIVGCHTYLGSEIRVAPGVEIPAFSIVAIGSVLTGRLDQSRVLIGGNPAGVLRPLKERDLFLVARKTRNDIPDDVAYAALTDDMRAALQEQGDRELVPSEPEA